MNQVLFASLIAVVAGGCVSAKSSFRDYSDLGTVPFEYTQKNASYTHTTVSGLCLFRTNPYLGIGTLYKGLHARYQLGPNQAFVNQRVDTVSRFYFFKCKTSYTLSADVVRFGPEHVESVPHPVSRPVVPHPSPVGQARVSEPAPQIPVPQAPAVNMPATVSANEEITVVCSTGKSVSGTPIGKTRTARVRTSTGLATVTVPLEEPQSCIVVMGSSVLETVLTPGQTQDCSLGVSQITCTPR